jgi:glycosyltransferase involved in cell wall biosynthesis
VDDVATAYAATDLVFVPSRRESFCRVAAEAMANGLPVVATDLPALREVLGHDSAGLFFPLEDASAAAEQLRRLVNDSDLRSRMGENGRLRAQAYQPDAVLDSFTKAYESFAHRRARNAG